MFDRAWIWIPNPATGVNGVYLIGPGPEAVLDTERVRSRLLAERVARDVQPFSAMPLARILPIPILRGAQIDAYCGTAPILRDGHPFLEFPLFRNAGRSDVMGPTPLMEFVSTLGHPR